MPNHLTITARDSKVSSNIVSHRCPGIIIQEINLSNHEMMIRRYFENEVKYIENQLNNCTDSDILWYNDTVEFVNSYRNGVDSDIDLMQLIGYCDISVDQYEDHLHHILIQENQLYRSIDYITDPVVKTLKTRLVNFKQYQDILFQIFLENEKNI